MAEYVEKDNGLLEKHITNVMVEQGRGDKYLIKWDWPKDTDYSYCFAYTLTEEEERQGVSLSELLEQKHARRIFDVRYPSEYECIGTRIRQRAYLFPAREQDGNYYVLDQMNGNCSEEFCAKIKIQWGVEYQSMDSMFGLKQSKYRRALLSLAGISRDMQGYYLVYRCVGGGRQNERFGIDLAFAGEIRTLEIVIGREEELVLERADSEQEKYIELKRIK